MNEMKMDDRLMMDEWNGKCRIDLALEDSLKDTVSPPPRRLQFLPFTTKVATLS